MNAFMMWLLVIWLGCWCFYRIFVKDKPIFYTGIWGAYWEPHIKGITLNEGGLPINLTILLVPTSTGYRLSCTMYFFGLRIHWALEIG